MSERAPTVLAATVTYGDRAELCVEVVRAALAQGAARVLVIDNGSLPRSAAILTDLERDGRVRVVDMAGNRGSAAGFARAVTEPDHSEFIWLLDDDSLLHEGALRELLRTHAELAEDGGKVGVFAHRTANAFQSRTIQVGASVLPVPGSFMYFDLRERVKPRRRHDVRATEPIRVPYGPYGGLLLKRSDLIGLEPPDVRLFLYEDDTEYTARLDSVGVDLWLVPSSTISDADEKWSESDSGVRGPARLLVAGNALRLYYSVRNRSRFDRRRSRRLQDRVFFWINLVCFVAIAALQGVTHRMLPALRTMLTAIARGVRNDLRPYRAAGVDDE